ncbi:MAG: M20/M25/M40 family metallo-hydrolase [Proteobacteria bacterium]|nr:M20/M25/M40 family metallo-hydrolase [Pseudomonadota bacterium]
MRTAAFAVIAWAVATSASLATELPDVQKRAILSEFMHLLKIPNVAQDSTNIRHNADAIIAMMQSRGLAPRLVESSRSSDAPPIVYGEWKVPNAKRTIVLYAHYDGQPVNPAEWTTAPWEPTLRSAPLEAGGSTIAADSIDAKTRLYARGTGDDKAGVIVILSAIDQLRQAHRTPTDNLKIVFEGEEEAGSPHLGQLLSEQRKLFESDLWVICDGPVHPTGRKEVIYGARGDINIDLTVYGPNRALHSGHYGNWAPNPGLRLARLLAAMKNDSGRVAIPGWYDDTAPLGSLEKKAIAAATAYDEPVRRDLGLAATESDTSLAGSWTEPSLNINGMRSANVAEQAANVIPASATAVLDVRLVLGNDPRRQFEKVLAFIRSQGYFVIDREPTADERLQHPLIANVRLRPGLYAAARTPMDQPLAHAIAAAVRASTRDEIIELPTSGGSLPLSIVQAALGTGAIVVPIANYDDNQHAANENLQLGNLWEGIATYTAVLTHPAPR